MVILWRLNQGLGPFPPKKLHHLLDVWMLTQSCYPLVTQPRFWPFVCCLVLLPFQDSYACKLSHRVLSSSLLISCPFFQEALPLAALFLEVVINLSFQLLSSVILFVSSVHSISYKNYQSPEMMKKYLNTLSPRKKRSCQAKNTSYAVV